jgi:hypothetical protein
MIEGNTPSHHDVERVSPLYGNGTFRVRDATLFSLVYIEDP